MLGKARLYVRAKVLGDIPDQPRLDVDIEIGAGITSVMGASGAGKTTLLTTITGLVQPHAGRIVLDDHELFDSAKNIHVPAHKRRVAIVFQSLALFPHLCAWENVAYGLPVMNKTNRRERAISWLARTRVEHRADRMPSSLSGGEAQRVAIARALASEPRALLLDEPFSALDGKLRQQLGEELRALIGELDIPALLVTHHIDDASTLGSRMLVIERGRINAS